MSAFADVAAPESAVDAIESRARVGRTTTREQREIVWRVWDAAPGATARGAVVLLHGSYGSWTHWLRMIEPLAHRYRVIAVDLPGFGDSGDAPDDDRSPPALARLLRDALAAARDPLLGDAPWLCVGGFSLGAVYAGWLARTLAEQPLPLRPLPMRLFLASPGGLGKRDHPLPAMVRIGAAMDASARVAAHRENLARVMFARSSAIDDLALRVQEANVAHARFRGTFTSRSDFLLEALPGLPMPVLAVWGDHDAFDPDVRVRVAALESVRPDARAEVVAGAGHWVIWEAAAAVEGHLARWLESDCESI